MIQSESRPRTSSFSKGGQCYDPMRNCGVVLKFERFSHLSRWSFRLDSPIGLGYGYLPLVLSLRVDV